MFAHTRFRYSVRGIDEAVHLQGLAEEIYVDRYVAALLGWHGER